MRSIEYWSLKYRWVDKRKESINRTYSLNIVLEFLLFIVIYLTEYVEIQIR